MITSVSDGEKFIHECGLAGERRADQVFPAHPNGIRLSRDRFLIVYATRGWTGTDDDRSIVYQVRKGAYDGPVLKEGLLEQSVEAWDPFGDGARCRKTCGAPVAFGRPLGALHRGRRLAHENLFVIKWYRLARVIRPDGTLSSPREYPELAARSLLVRWCQVRLNPAGGDLEVLQGPETMREAGYGEGGPLCSAGVEYDMNQSFTDAVPLDGEASEWLHTHHFCQLAGNNIRAIRIRYEAARHRYAWVQTGPPLFPEDRPAFEASTVRLHDGWALCARPRGAYPAFWLRTEDLFGKPAAVLEPDAPRACGPLTVYRFADGTIRMMTGDEAASPYRRQRCPLYVWDIDPHAGFKPSNRRVVIDPLAQGLPLRLEANPVADMSKLLSHTGGCGQLALFRVRTGAIGYPMKWPAATEAELEAHGIYLGTIAYGEAYESAWEFAP